MAMNLFFTPLIVKNLGSESYGLQSLVNVIIGFLMVADMGLDIPVTKSVAEFRAKNETIKLNELLNSTLVIYLLIGCVGLIFLVGLSPILADYVFKVPDEYRDRSVYVFYLAGFGFVGGLFSMWGRAIFDGFLRYDISNGINVISNLLSITIGTILVVNGYGVVVYVLVRVAFTFLTGFAYLIVGKRLLQKFSVSINVSKTVWDMLKTQIGYGFLLRISGIITSRLDQVLIGIWIGVAAVGYYSIPLLILTSLTGLLNSMTHYLFPQMSELSGTGKVEELKDLFIKASRYVGILAFVIYTPFIVFGSKFLHLWVGDSIANNSSTVFMFLLVAGILSALSAAIVNFYLVAIGRLNLFTKYILIRSGSIGLLMLFTISSIGLNGAGLAMVFGSFLDIIYCFLITRNFLKINVFSLFIGLYLKLTIISIVVGLGVKYLLLEHIHNITFLLISGFGYFIVFILFSFLLKIFNQEDLDLFKTMKNRLF